MPRATAAPQNNGTDCKGDGDDNTHAEIPQVRLYTYRSNPCCSVKRSLPLVKPSWTVDQIPGGYVVKDATGQALAYVYARDGNADADTATVLTMDEARRIAANIAKLPELLASKL